MVQRKSTPEEQLLKLIEGSGAKPEDSKMAGAAKPKRGSVFGRAPGFISYFKTQWGRREIGAPWKGISVTTLDIKGINRILMGMIFATVIYLLLDLVILKPSHANFLAQVSTSDPVYPVLEKQLQTSEQDLALYKQSFQKRNPFFLPSAQPADESGVPGSLAMSTGSTSRVVQALQGLKLVGVSLGGRDPIAMVEDESTGRTYFLRHGQEVRGVKVQSIRQEKVTVTFEGEEGELL